MPDFKSLFQVLWLVHFRCATAITIKTEDDVLAVSSTLYVTLFTSGLTLRVVDIGIGKNTVKCISYDATGQT